MSAHSSILQVRKLRLGWTQWILHGHKSICLFKVYLYAANERKTCQSLSKETEVAPAPQSCREEQEEMVLNKNFIILPNLGPLWALKKIFFPYRKHISLEFWTFHINNTSHGISIVYLIAWLFFWTERYMTKVMVDFHYSRWLLRKKSFASSLC